MTLRNLLRPFFGRREPPITRRSSGAQLPPLTRPWWPKLENLDAARETARLAGWTTIVAGLIIAVWGVFQVVSGTIAVWPLLINVVILGILGTLIFRFSRVASLIATLLILANVIFLQAAYPNPGIRPASALIFCVVGPICVGGVRAAFAWHRLVRHGSS